MSFIIYDVTFLVLFTLFVTVFLYRRRHNLKREGLLYLYRTKVGLRIIEYTSKRYARILKPLEYVVIASGYFLMALMLWFLGKFAYTYVTSPSLASELRVPVLTPLIPYIDKLFAVDFLPPFYFTYWIIIIAVIAIPHEFAHGIFARLNKVRIHSTGFGFLGPFLAAFVEQNDKDMQKAKKFPQLAILAAGTFANVLMMVLFGILLWLFVAAAFVPAGVYFNTYSASVIGAAAITSINGIALPEGSALLDTTNESLVRIEANNYSYFIEPSRLKRTFAEGRPELIVYEDYPAVRAQLQGAITHIDDAPITSYESLREAIVAHNPGEGAIIKTNDHGIEKEYNIIFAEKDGNAFLGIGRIPFDGKGLRGLMYSFVAKIKDPLIYYESKIGDFGIFIYHLLWWTVIINASVALVNMLPVGIFDGGRFFYLTIWGITGSQRVGMRAFKISTWAIVALVALLMLKWLVVIF